MYTDEIVKGIHEKFDPGKGALVLHYEPENAQLAVDRDRLRELGLDLDAIRRYLEAQPFIFAAYTEDELARAAASLDRQPLAGGSRPSRFQLLLSPEDRAPFLVLGHGHAALDADPRPRLGCCLLARAEQFLEQ